MTRLYRSRYSTVHYWWIIAKFVYKQLNMQLSMFILRAYSVSQNIASPKTFCNIFIKLSIFPWNFDLLPVYRLTSFGWFTMIFNKMALILPRCMECRRGLAMRILSVCQPVCLSVRLSVKHVDYDKMKEKCDQIFIPCERSFSLVFWEEKRLMGATPSTWNFGSTGLRWSEIADFEQIFARSTSSVTASEKVQLTLIGSPLRAFQWA